MKLAMEHSTTNRLSNRQQHLLSCNEIGKKTKPLYEQYLDKPNSVLVHDDIQGSKPLSTLSRKTAHFNVRYADQSAEPRESNYRPTPIEHNHPDVFQFKTQRQSGNPLEPKYPVASFSKSVQKEAKFIRDAMHCRDIDGAYPTKGSRLNIQTVTNKIDFPQKSQRRISNGPSSLQVADINQDQVYSHRSVRVSNPLVPSYQIHNTNLEIGDQKAHIKVRSPLQRDHTQYDVKDIIGDTIQQRYNSKPTHPSQVNADINGAQAGTRRIKIETVRNINPLMPKYTQLDGTPNEM